MARSFFSDVRRTAVKFGRRLAVLILIAAIAAPLTPAQARSHSKSHSRSYAASYSNARYAAIVMDAETGMILYQANADKALHPASLAKIMTLLLTFEAIEDGQLRLGDRITISSHAAAMVPSKLNIPAGSTIRTEDAIYAVVTKSANDIAVALAERIGGTESRFAAMMNRKASEIGMTKTYFRNASGLHNPAQVTSARDMAKLARYVLTAYPQYYHYFSTRQFAYNGSVMVNHNRLMLRYQGMDGFKTGFIQQSGFNLVASAVRNNRRLIGVVFGGQTAGARDAHMASLLNNSFSKLDTVLVARNTPLPARKPDANVQLASADDDSDDQDDSSPRWAELNPIMQSKAFSALIGQGDYDPSVTKRLETGLLAIAALKGSDHAHKGRRGGSASASDDAGLAPAAGNNWAVQIGAFTSRIKTDTALRHALAALPGDLSGASAVIAPLKTDTGWLFRGRLSGFSREGAQRACSRLKNCLPIAPVN
jgi:D-alanyl-D-alanine carboxypeptidase